jgi:hypothetical protein
MAGHEQNGGDAAVAGGGQGEGGEGRHKFTFTYDDTGATATVVAANGWTMQRVVDEAYAALGEAPQPEDRVEFGGTLLDVPHRAMKVKAFVEAGLAVDGRFHVVSRPGGA